MPVKDLTVRCETCRFFEPETGRVVGFCRRYPPRLPLPDEDERIPLWPAVTPVSWCGEWKAVAASPGYCGVPFIEVGPCRRCGAKAARLYGHSKEQGVCASCEDELQRGATDA